ncbi:MAG: hypothetical protein RLW61_02360 [Gammaproteobacteria bacterium]
MRGDTRRPRVRHGGRDRVLALLLLVTWALTACTQPRSPSEVSEQFWRAVLSGDPAALEPYVLARDRALLDGGDTLLPVAGFTLGRVVIDADDASVQTGLTLAGDTPVTLEIDTVLRREDDAWRVDYRETVDAVRRRGELAQVIGRIGALGEALERGVEQSMDEMRRVLPAIENELSRIERELQQQVPALRERFESFARELEKSLERAPPESAPPPPPPEGTIAL